MSAHHLELNLDKTAQLFFQGRPLMSMTSHLPWELCGVSDSDLQKIGCDTVLCCQHHWKKLLQINSPRKLRAYIHSSSRTISGPGFCNLVLQLSPDWSSCQCHLTFAAPPFCGSLYFTQMLSHVSAPPLPCTDGCMRPIQVANHTANGSDSTFICCIIKQSPFCQLHKCQPACYNHALSYCSTKSRLFAAQTSQQWN